MPSWMHNFIFSEFYVFRALFQEKKSHPFSLVFFFQVSLFMQLVNFFMLSESKKYCFESHNKKKLWKGETTVRRVGGTNKKHELLLFSTLEKKFLKGVFHNSLRHSPLPNEHNANSKISHWLRLSKTNTKKYKEQQGCAQTLILCSELLDDDIWLESD